MTDHAQRTDEDIARLEQMLREDTELAPGGARRISELLGTIALKDLIHVLERMPSVRAALILRLLPRQRSIVAFEALDAAHQADLVDALGDDSLTSFFPYFKIQNGQQFDFILANSLIKMIRVLIGLHFWIIIQFWFFILTEF